MEAAVPGGGFESLGLVADEHRLKMNLQSRSQEGEVEAFVCERGLDIGFLAGLDWILFVFILTKIPYFAFVVIGYLIGGVDSVVSGT